LYFHVVLLCYRSGTVAAYRAYRRNLEIIQESRAIAGRTARCRCKFRYASNFTMTSSRFSATARLYCIHQRPFKMLK